MSQPIDSGPTSLRQKLALRGIDGVTLLILPSVLFLLGIFIYPFFYGLMLSFTPIREGGISGCSPPSSSCRSRSVRCWWRRVC
jgi:putative spermidine/putrescine transport system permease protein